MNLPAEIELCTRPVNLDPCGQRLHLRSDGHRYCRLHGDVGTEAGEVYVKGPRPQWRFTLKDGRPSTNQAFWYSVDGVAVDIAWSTMVAPREFAFWLPLEEMPKPTLPRLETEAAEGPNS